MHCHHCNTADIYNPPAVEVIDLPVDAFIRSSVPEPHPVHEAGTEWEDLIDDDDEN